MKIEDYIRREGKGIIPALAKRSGLHSSTVRRVISGDVRPDLTTCKALSDATGGAVSLTEWARIDMSEPGQAGLEEWRRAQREVEK